MMNNQESKNNSTEKQHFLLTHEYIKNNSLSQIGISACGPTVILNILQALNYDNIPQPQKFLKVCEARRRNYDT